MKIQTTISDSAIEDVTEYCRIEGIDLHGRMQQELDDFVDKAITLMEQLRNAKDWIKRQEGELRETVNAR